jgi:hypothetical protein
MSADKMPPLPDQDGWAVRMNEHLVLFCNNVEKARGAAPGASHPVFAADKVHAYARAYAAEQTRELVEALHGCLFLVRLKFGNTDEFANAVQEQAEAAIAKHKGQP